MRRYRIMRIPYEAWEGFSKKQKAIQEMLKNDLKSKSKFHLTDTMKFFSQRQTLVFPNELEGFISNNKRKRKVKYPLSI